MPTGIDNYAVRRRFLGSQYRIAGCKDMKNPSIATSVVLTTIMLGASECSFAGTAFSYQGICDASAAAALDANHFVVADDERNTLVVFRRGNKNAVGATDVSGFLGTKPDKESDIEGAATIDNRTYWISSQGRNSKGEKQERRLRFFATDVVTDSSGPKVITVSRPYSSLLDDLIAEPQFAALNLADAASRAPEEKSGLNIEGLAATPDKKLLIGFRNPIPGQKALVVLLENPQEVVQGKTARFGTAMLLDLNNRGIRSIERVGTSYVIAAGPTDDSGPFALYRWSGDPAQAPTVLSGIDFTRLHPEAMFAIPSSRKVQILSDDGQRPIGGVECKRNDRSKMMFRSVTVELP